ncbi:MAG: AraC family transcriptional regulator [Blastocatellia bacterium]
MNSKVRSIVNFLNANLHRQIRMAEITALVGLSHSRVHDLFKAELGISPMQYLKRLRLEKARALLENSAMKIKQIRLEVGYQDHRDFFRDFKKQFGLTPSEYRAQCLATALTESGPTK